MNHSPASVSVECLLQSAADIDVTMRRVTLFVNVLFRNTGQQPIAHPRIVIAVSPERACEISGKILSPQLIQTLAVYVKGGRQSGWKFTDDNWFRSGKASGEYHIEAIEPLTLSPGGGWTEMKDLQIECDLDKLAKPLTVNAFIMAQDTRFSALNSICISISA
ncbi:D-Tyr-tRNAtyr deacylase [Paenibacillus apiarius]|uniref:D-Tyr-tRNAtyr deacylase n=1 Tax=Paenibacillus apiarius TaxID=46240 RepID=A0ABT4DRG9_9BACL|nr:D-Tyr-tRNAtyr deacylase [Paenibacillus apiarius]MBN3523157.1 D-Tyr-tRNAtyr deacylase [Paenibacillus apiarius]MCY9512559.1 D-Tyr-tRNAtyr deacylase [Paenibacillus apiarius]MCY9519830.1 D-Tyr-tRNAtyr deacylase [Paenibacillus apiarius]MCY9553147.1 D-Tyr-tRNAtyr deacylase [Paenibacillus apiarius]MCY9559285.1 D-Tyr-tRNAtyr deacylase [Paenibacillus apiarius]